MTVLNKIRIAVIDDSREFCSLLGEHFRRSPDFEFVGAAHSGEDGVRFIKETRPDAVLIDMIMPNGDGLFVLEELQNAEMALKLVKFVLTGSGSEFITTRAQNLGADYIFIKPFSFQMMEERIKQLYNNKMSQQQTFKEIHRETSMEENITELLLSFGIPSHLKGYKYLRKAIMYCVNDMELIGAVTKVLYPEVAKEYNTNEISVEHAIRNAINLAWKKEESVNYYKRLGLVKDSKPTNSVFIASIADYLNLKKMSGVYKKYEA